jgi:hypothetical protein
LSKRSSAAGSGEYTTTLLERLAFAASRHA